MSVLDPYGALTIGWWHANPGWVVLFCAAALLAAALLMYLIATDDSPHVPGPAPAKAPRAGDTLTMPPVTADQLAILDAEIDKHMARKGGGNTWGVLQASPAGTHPSPRPGAVAAAGDLPSPPEVPPLPPETLRDAQASYYTPLRGA